MKKNILFFIFLILNYFLSFSQTDHQITSPILDMEVNVSYSHASIEEVLQDLSNEHGFLFSYINNQIPLESIVSVELKNGSLKDLLEKIFINTDVRYFEVGNMIVLKKEIINNENNTLPEKPNIAKDTIINKVAGKDSSIRITITPKSTPSINHFKKQKFHLFGKRTIIPHVEKQQDSTLSASHDSIAEFSDTLKPANTHSGKITHNDNFYKWSISTYLSPEVSYRILEPISSRLVEERNSVETKKCNFTYGISLDYYFTRHFSIQSGLNYLRVGENGQYTVYGHHPPPKMGPPDNSLYPIEKVNYSNKYEYLGLPFSLAINTGNQLYVSIQPGMSLGVLLSHSTNYPNDPGNPYMSPQLPYEEQHYRSNLDPEKHNYRNTNLISMLSIQTGYKTKNNFCIFIAPSFKYFITSIYSSKDIVKEHPYSFGLQIGMKFLFHMRKQQ